MIFVLLLLIFCIITPLAVNRGLFKRVLVLALALEILKYLFSFALGHLLKGLECEGVCFLLAIFAVVMMLPEMMIGHVHEPLSIWREAVMFGAGIIWNMIPAYFIFLCLPEQQGADDLNKPLPTSSI